MALQRIGIFGGSFDPIHIGHLIIARDAMEQLELDRILFLPSARAPLKPQAHTASESDRLEMVSRALSSEPGFESLDIEIKRGGTSYSIDTAQEIEIRCPGARLFWIIGGDQSRQLDKWIRIEELAKRVEFICFARGEIVEADPAYPEGVTIHHLSSRRLDISSTEIRSRLKKGLSAKYFLPDEVLDYIKARNLYGEDRDKP